MWWEKVEKSGKKGEVVGENHPKKLIICMLLKKRGYMNFSNPQKQKVIINKWQKQSILRQRVERLLSLVRLCNIVTSVI
jgi:hypothetical protein